MSFGFHLVTSLTRSVTEANHGISRVTRLACGLAQRHHPRVGLLARPYTTERLASLLSMAVQR